MPVKILYFAWVREKTGKAEEILDRAGRRRHGGGAGGLAQGPGARNTPRPSPAPT